ncbi:MAG: hypothetical protein ACI9MR_004573 [Myxococcota bacterium]|jgi:hypothetical protein
MRTISVNAGGSSVRLRLVALSFALLLIPIGAPSTLEVGPWLGTGVFAGWTAWLSYILLRRNLPYVAVFVMLNALGYGASVGDGLALGLTRVGLTATPASAWLAMWALLGFLSVISAVAVALNRRTPKVQRTPVSSEWLGAVNIGFWLLFSLCALAAFATSSWTNYGGAQVTRDTGGLRAELLYASMLLAAAGWLAMTQRGKGEARRSRLHRWIRVAMISGVALLLFAMQSRRLMLAAAALVGTLWLLDHTVRTKPAANRAVKGLILVAALGLGLVASAAWRDAARQQSTHIGLFEGVTAAFTKLDSFDPDEVNERMTYFWVDATTIELSRHLDNRLSAADVFVAQLAFVTPTVIFAGKRDIPLLTCETVYDSVGVQNDLPCTAITEAFLAGGWFTLLWVAGLWGLFLGLLEHLRLWGGPLGRLFSLIALAEFTTIETGLFPMLQGIRDGLLTVLFVGFCALALIGVQRLARRGARPDAPAGQRRYPPG